MASRTLNPRFDHTCKVYRLEGGTEFTDGTETVLYEGKCYVYEANNLRQYLKNNSVKEDMGCDVPGLVTGVRAGDFVDFDRYGESVTRCVIGNAIPSKMGTTFRFNRPKV